MSVSKSTSNLQWAVMPGARFRVCESTVSQLPPAAYDCVPGERGVALSQRQLHTDELIDFPGSLAAHILDEINKFWGLADRFHQYGFLHRRGYLLHGKQGTGKSSLVHLIVSRAVQCGCIAFFCDQPYLLGLGVEQLRAVEPNRPIICVFEDIDAFFRHSGDVELLQWLDGNRQVDKVVNIATTNFPERLDRRIISRPRRFDRVLEIGSPDNRLREAYFAAKIPDLAEGELQRWVNASDGLSFAALAELIIGVRCLDYDLREAAAQLKELDLHKPSCHEIDDWYDDDDFDRPKMKTANDVSDFVDAIPF